MMVLELSRWQFGITTVFHFLFVPLTIGLAFLLAVMQTAAYLGRHDATKSARWNSMCSFWRKLFLINFAIGVVTGIVQEFQFGMNWSVYSRYVGSVFGAPLAIEGLLAFFLESTFLGIWIFGRDRVSARVHLVSIWLVCVGTTLSALFILAANSWMQNPVGYKIVGNRAVMTNFWAVMTNSVLINAFLHVFFAALVTSTMLVLGVSAWHLLKDLRNKREPRDLFATSAKVALAVGSVAIVATMIFGDSQGKQMETLQPMKMAAAEALYNTEHGASFSLLTIGDLSGNPIFQIRLPHLLSVLADSDWNGTVQGVNQLQAKDVVKYGPGNYKPILWVTYWSFRVMVGCGMLMFLLSAVGLWLMRRRRLERSRWFLKFCVLGILLPFAANTTGWIFTEMGRQPWVVYGLLKTSQAVSHLGTGYVVATLVGFTAIYSLLAAIDFGLMAHFARDEAGEGEQQDESEAGNDQAPALVY
jgi:cytochrome d ubiquinol oxidase subunit I